MSPMSTYIQIQIHTPISNSVKTGIPKKKATHKHNKSGFLKTWSVLMIKLQICNKTAKTHSSKKCSR
jgi:hypothetical protein